MQIVLYQPEIPPNTGNVARLCAATGTRLNLIEPLGFSLEDKYLRRAGLDYWPHVDVRVWPGWEEFLAGRSPGEESGTEQNPAPRPGRLVYTSSNAGARYDRFGYRSDDLLVFGPETRGLPQSLVADQADLVRIPILSCVRSLNLSTSAGILLFEALRHSGGLHGLEKGASPASC